MSNAPPATSAAFSCDSELRAGRILLAAALLSGLLHCWPLMADFPLALDELASYWVIQPDGGPSVWARCEHYLATPPLGHWIQQGALAAFGTSERMLRLPSVVALLAAIVMVNHTGRIFMGPTAAGAAAVVFAWHPLVLDEVRIARCYGWVVLFSAGLLYCSLRWAEGERCRRWPWLWSATAAALVWTHYVAIPFIGLCWLVPAGTWLIRREFTLRRLGTLLAAGGLAVLLSLPLTTAIDRVWTWGETWHLFSTSVPLHALVGSEWWLGLPAAMLAARLPGGRRRRPAGDPPEGLRQRLVLQLAVLAFGLTLAGAAAQWAGQPSLASSRYRTSASVPAALLFALVLVQGRSLRGVCIGLVAGIAATWAVLDHPPWRAPRLDNPMDYAWRDMAQTIEAEGKPGEPVFVQAGVIEAMLLPAFYEDSTFSEYVAFSMCRFYLPSEHPRYGLPYNWRRPATMAEWYRRRLNRAPGGRTWLAAAMDTDLNRASASGFDALARSAGLSRSSEREFGNAALVEYRAPQQAPAQ